MTKRSDITPEMVSQSLIYNPITGEFIWKKRPIEHFPNERVAKIWNTKWSGKKAGNDHKSGFTQISIFNVRFRANKVAVAIVTGKWPSYEVDHKNLNPHDNRWENLRIATRSENGRNRRKQKNNTTGYKGACYDKSRGKYISIIAVNGVQKNLGRFDTAEQAHEAYCKAAAELHGEFARTS
jgi:hypothetical protein